VKEKPSASANFNSIWPAIWIVPAAMALIALAPLPYGYYVLLRIAVCGAAAFLAWTHYNVTRKIGAWIIGLGLIAVLFNPLTPIHLNRDIWAVIDIGAVVVFGVHYYTVRFRR
jgi:hypothetical protein